MAHRKPQKLAEITNTPRGRKTAVEEPEHGVVVSDSDLVELHLAVSDDSCYEEDLRRMM